LKDTETTMRALLKTGFVLLLLAFGLIGASYTVLRAHGSSGAANPGNRLLATEKRPLAAAVTTVELNGPINLTLRQGPDAALEVRGEQRLLANIDTTVDGAVLHVGPRGLLLRHRQPIEVTVTLPALDTLHVNGSGDATASGFAGERLDLSLGGSGTMRFNGRYRDNEVALHGSGDLELTAGSSERVKAESIGSGNLTLVGATRTLQAELRGSGELDARHLRAEEVRLEHTGSGSSAIYASHEAAVELSGSGDATVYGNPARRDVSRHGSASVSFHD
jgi:hypothetical protein